MVVRAKDLGPSARLGTGGDEILFLPPENERAPSSSIDRKALSSGGSKTAVAAAEAPGSIRRPGRLRPGEGKPIALR